MTLDRTHSPGARSWVEAANILDCDFPIQNLPFASFRPRGVGDVAFRGGVAIGDQVLDLGAIHERGLLSGLAFEALAAAGGPRLNPLLALTPAHWGALRLALFDLLDAKASDAVKTAAQAALVPMETAEYQVPTDIGDYTDCLSSYYHYRNCAEELESMAGGVPASFHAMPLSYHGRSSSIVISGTPIRRPCGQVATADPGRSVLAASARLDYECELGIFIGGENRLGQPLTLADARARIFGVCLLNDWSARDIQGWEMSPLGPFHSKNFGTSLSPWIVTSEALKPFRCAWSRSSDLPQPLPYLDSPWLRESGGVDIRLEVLLQTPERTRAALTPARLSHTSFRHTHWTFSQLLAHHAVNGCNLRPGDVIGSGTISGPSATEAGALLELSRGGKRPVELPLEQGATEQRTFLEDGDTVTLRGWCETPGFRRIGFGDCDGTITSAIVPETFWREEAR